MADPVTAVRIKSPEGTVYYIPDDYEVSPGVICGNSTEVEMQEFLYGLVRYLKPEITFESGAYKGYGTRALGMACKANDHGRVISCEPDTALADFAKETVAEYPMVDIRACRSEACPELKEADLIFSDSGFDSRGKEWTSAKKGCVFVVHDTRLDPNLNLMVESNQGLLFNRGRGFGILIKR